MALTITPEDLRALYNDLTSQGYSHETLVNAAMQNYGIDLDTALASQGPISYTDNINSGPLETAPQPSYADYQASQPTYNEPIETEAVTGVRPGALASVTPQPVYTEPVYTPEPVYTEPVYTEPVYTEPVYDPGPVFTPTADVSLTPSGGGALASVAALEPVVEVPAAISDQAIVDWFGNNPSEFDTVAAMVRHGVTEADIQRATGKTLQELYPSVSDQSGGASSTAVSNTSGALPVSTDTIAAVSDTGGALPVSTDTTGTSATGALSTVGSADAYRYTADPNAGQYVFDPVTGKHKLLSADQVYNNVEIPTFTDQYGFQEDSGTVVKTAAQQLTDWQAEQDRRAALTPVQRAIEDARYTVGTEGGVDTGYNAVNIGGNEWTVTPGGDSLIKMSQDQSGLGAKQYRYDLLDPVTGQVTQQIGVEGPGLWKSFLTNPVTGLILGLALPGVGSAIGSALGATTAAGAAALGSGVLNFGLQVAAGADPIDALKGAVLSAGAGFAGAQVSSMLPAELASAGKSAVTQLITTGKLDPAALATSVGTSFATDALAAETGLDKASAAKLVTAGLQAIQGNELAALTSLAQVGLQSGLSGTGVTAQSPQDRAAFLEANAAPLGLYALSPNPSEDDFIDLEQRTNSANALLSNYVSPGSDLSRESAISQLTALGINTTRANEIISNADAQIEANRLARVATANQNQAAINAGAGEFAGADARTAIAAGAGEFVDTRASQAVLDSISNAKTFNDAFAAARTAFGPGSTFNWQGKLYSTATAEENPALSGKPILTTNAFNNTIQDGDIASRLNMGLDATDVRSMINEWNSATDTKRLELLRNPAYAGIKAIYDEKASTKQLSPSEIASTIRSGASGSISATPESAWVLGARDLAGAIQDTVALVTGEPGNTAAILNRAGGQMLQAVGGVSSTLGATDLGRELTLAGKTIEEIGESTSTYAGTQQQIINNINAQSNWGDKLITAGKSALTNPGAIGDWIATEALQEGPALLAFGAVRTGKAAASLLTDGLETMGFAWNDARAAALESGKSITESNKLADKAAWLSGATTLAVAGVLDDRAIKALQDFKAGRITQETAKEAVGGALDEGGTQAIVQAVATGKLDPNAIGTAAVLGGMIESKTSGALTTVGQGAYDNATAVDNISQQLTSGADTNTALSGSINSALSSGASSTGAINSTLVGALNNNIDPAVAVSSTLTGALNNNLNTNTAVSTVISSAIANDISPATAISSAIDSTLNNGNVNSLTVAGTATSTAIGSSLSTTGNASSSINGAITGALNNNLATNIGVNGSTALAVNTSLSGALNSGVMPGTAITNVVTSTINNGGNTSTAVASAIATALSSGVDTNTAVTTALNAASSNNLSTATGNNLSTATGNNLSVDTGNNLSTATGNNLSVDTNTSGNVTTAIVTDSNNNTSTTVTNNGNTNTSTTTVVNNNTGSSTTTTINNNTGIVVTEDVDVDSGLTVNTVVDANTGTQTTTVTNTNTGTVVDTVTRTLVNTDTVEGGGGNDTLPGGGVVDTIPGGSVIDITPAITLEPTPLTLTATPLTPTSTTQKTPTPSGGGGGALPSLLMGGTGPGALPGAISPTMLEGAPIEALMNLPQLMQLYPQLANVDQRLLQMLSGRGGQTGGGDTGAGNLPTALSMTQAGAEPSPGMPAKSVRTGATPQTTDLLGSTGPLSGKLDPLTAAGLTALEKGIGYAKGGLSQAHQTYEHNPEFITGATGYYVKGRGDGQSDDIPAMLADGEYVFDADTVAALGNGSSDAGAKILDKMRENIRKHKRSAHHSKIPPKAKSPLEYLKG